MLNVHTQREREISCTERNFRRFQYDLRLFFSQGIVKDNVGK
jgi:hypothetical protein